MPKLNSHTHRLTRNAIVNIDPVGLSAGRPALRPGYSYSVGIHPWNILTLTPRDLRLLRALAADPRVLAIGECGLDPKITHPADISRNRILAAQTELLKIHFDLSESLRKPLLLHIVRAFPEIIALKKQWRPTRPWIIHGFRGKPQLARELLAHGFHLSFGLRYNPDSLALTPPSRLLRETDTI